jgi:hypothetical protein
MAASKIDIKIKALVEGLDSIKELALQLGLLGKSGEGATEAGAAIADLGAAAQDAAAATETLSSTTQDAAAGLQDIASSGQDAASGAQDAANGLNDAAGAATQAAPAVGDFADSLADLKSSSSEALAELRALKTGMDEISSKLNTAGGYAKKAALAFAALVFAKGIKEMADYAARTETLGITMGIVAKNAGYSTGAIAGYEKELKKLGITTQAARDSITKMIQAGIPLEGVAGEAASNIGKLARAAQDLAVVTGENSSQTLQRLVTNIQQMDSMGLRFMGLTIDIEAAQDEFAKSIDKTASALSKQQKIMAVNNAVLKESGKLTGAYEASMEAVGKKAASLTRYQDELADSLGKKLLPAYGRVVDTATVLLTQLTAISVAMEANTEVSERFGGTVGHFTNTLAEAVVSIAEFVAADFSAIEAFGSSIAGIVTDLINFVFNMGSVLNQTGIFSSTLLGLNLTIAAFRDGLSVLELVFYGLTGAAVGFIGLAIKGFGELANIAGNNEFGDGLIKTGNAFLEAGKKADEMSDKIVDNFAKSNTHINAMVTGVEKASATLADFGKTTDLSGLTKEFELLAKNSSSLLPSDFAEASKRVTDSLLKIAKGGKYSAEEMTKLYDAAGKVGITLPEGWDTAEAAVKTYNAELKTSEEVLGLLGKSTDVAGIRAEFEELATSTRANVLDTVDQARAFDLMEVSLKNLREGGKASKKDMRDLEDQLKGLGATLDTNFNASIKSIGVTTAEMAAGVSPKILEVASGLTGLAGSALVTGQRFEFAFAKSIDTSKSVTEISKMVEALAVAERNANRLAESGKFEESEALLTAVGASADRVKLSFEKAFDTELKSAKTASDFARLRESVTSVSTATGATAAQVTERMGRISQAAQDAADETSDADVAGLYAAIGISADEMEGRVTPAVEQAGLALKSMVVSATIDADQFAKAFSKGLDTAKTLQDLQTFRDIARAAFGEGKIGWQEYAGELAAVNSKFQEMFQAKLGAADTKAELEALRKELAEIGEVGGISGPLVADALKMVEDKATDATAGLRRVAKAAREIATAALDITTQESAILTSQNGVQRAKNDLLQAQNVDREEGTALSRAELEVTRLDFQLANDMLLIERATLTEKETALKVTEAEAELAEAEAAFKLEASDANAERVVSAKEHLTSVAKTATQAELVALRMKQAAEETRKAKIEAEGLAAKLKDAGSSGGSSMVGVKVLALSLQNVVDLYEKAGLSADAAAGKAEAFMQGQGKYFTAFGSEAMDKLFDMYAELQEIRVRVAKEAAEAKKIKEAFDDALKSKQYQDAGLGDWKRDADAVTKAYQEIKLQAYNAAKGAKDAAQSFINAASGLQEELLTAQGKDDEAAALRFANRKRDLALQYEALKVQVSIARVTALAAGVSTVELDRTAAAAEASFNKSLTMIDELEKIDTTKRKEAKEAEKEAAAKQAAEEAASKQAEIDQQAADAQQEKLEGLKEERDIREDIANTATDEFKTGLSDQVTAAASNGQAPAAQSIARNAGRPQAGQLNVVDVTKVTLNIGGKEADVFTQPGDDAGLLRLLTDYSTRA